MRRRRALASSLSRNSPRLRALLRPTELNRTDDHLQVSGDRPMGTAAQGWAPSAPSLAGAEEGNPCVGVQAEDGGRPGPGASRAGHGRCASIAGKAPRVRVDTAGCSLRGALGP